MTRITITLSDEEKVALRALAEKEFREPQGQAALIIRRELERQGFIEVVNQNTCPVQSIMIADQSIRP
jgi:predicted transcriptional regulator